MKKIHIYLLLSIIPLFGKGFQHHNKDDVIIRDHYHYSIESVDKLETKIEFKMGELILEPNTDHPNEFDGFAEYNPRYFESPNVDYTVLGRTGILEIRTNLIDLDSPFDWDNDHFHNKGVYKLPLSVPIELELDFGFGESEINLTGIPIQSLDIECGMGSGTLEIESRNPIVCRNVNINAGMGEFDGSDLSFLQAEVVDINVGLGTADIDFSGSINQDMDIAIDVGLGSIELIFPNNVNISARVEDHFLSSVDLNNLVKKRNKYVTEKWDYDRPTITLDMSVGLGSIDLEISD